MVSFGTVQKQQFKLVETGEYVFTLNDLGEVSGDYGDRMTWDFLVAPKEDPTNYISMRDDGKAKIIKMFTDPEVTLGSRQHEWIQALTGRSFGDGADLPDGSELLSKRMVAYLTHYTPKKGKNAGIAKEDIVAGSAKPFALTSRRANGGAAPAAPSRPALDQVTADATDDDIERAAVAADIKKSISSLKKLDSEAGAAAQQAFLDSDENASADELRVLLGQVKDAINKAMDE